MTDAPPAVELTTPVRELGVPVDAGVHQLGSSTVQYEDGAEQGVLEKLNAATDLSSLSDELPAVAENIHEAYHFSRSRANALRALRITDPERRRVLEIGAGCGALSRWLGEQGMLVDALEPMPIRAKCAVARTRDLENVHVFCGDLADVPAAPTYDVIVLNGVLEYVAGNGTSDEDVAAFLASIRPRLATDGVLFIAIENKLGVKYLAGAPEDHTGRLYDGVEDYPRGTHARTLSRATLARVLDQSGYSAKFLQAFPDYKETRAIFDDGLLAHPRLSPLAWRTPIFPSPGPISRHASEHRMWRSLVEDGVGERFGNSFVVLATQTDEAVERWWPTTQRGAYFSTHRRSTFTTITRIEQTADGAQLTRERLAGEEPTASAGPIMMRTFAEELVDGPTIVEFVSRGGEPSAVLPGWIELLRAHRSTPGHEHDSDVLPQNCIVQPDGSLVFIDQEFIEDRSESDLIVRGLVIAAMSVARNSPNERWLPCLTVADLVKRFADDAQYELPDDWRERYLSYEAELRGWMLGGSGSDIREPLNGALDTNLEDQPLGVRATITIPEHERNLDVARAEMERLATLVTQAEASHAALVEELAAIRSSRAWKVLERIRRLVRR